MVHPVRIQVRYSTVLVIVLLLMGSVLYEVTRTEGMGRQSAARTQDISLPAAQPIEHRIRPVASPDYIGHASGRAAWIRAEQSDDSYAVAGGGTAASLRVASARSYDFDRDDAGASFSGALTPRVHSASGGGFAPGAYGMSGVGAWGGVSGVMRPAPAVTTPKVAAAKPARVSRGNSNSSSKRPTGGSSGSGGGATAAAGQVATLPPGGFTTGAAAVDGQTGSVASLTPTGTTGKSSSPASAPAATPEPMSLLLMGTGVVALFTVRRRLQ